MKGLAKILSAVCVILGSIIGAGFVTGKEIFNFFYGVNPLIAGICSFVLFSLVFSFVFVISSSQRAHSINQLLKKVYGRLSLPIEYFIVLCYFLVLSTMLSGANLCLSQVIGINERLPLFSALTAVVAGCALFHGIKGIKLVNAVCVPIILLFTVIACTGNHPESSLSVSPVSPCIAYACFNCLMSLGIVISLSRDLTVKQGILTALISSAVIAFLILIIASKLNDEVYALTPMPLLAIAKGYGNAVYVLASLILYVSVLTSIVSGAYPVINAVLPLVKSKQTATVSVMFFAVLFSMMGFEFIVDRLYPVMAVFGVALFSILFAFSIPWVNRFFLPLRPK